MNKKFKLKIQLRQKSVGEDQKKKYFIFNFNFFNYAGDSCSYFRRLKIVDLNLDIILKCLFNKVLLKTFFVLGIIWKFANVLILRLPKSKYSFSKILLF